jgi:hypothetical protein
VDGRTTGGQSACLAVDRGEKAGIRRRRESHRAIEVVAVEFQRRGPMVTHVVNACSNGVSSLIFKQQAHSRWVPLRCPGLRSLTNNHRCRPSRHFQQMTDRATLSMLSP